MSLSFHIFTCAPLDEGICAEEGVEATLRPTIRSPLRKFGVCFGTSARSYLTRSRDRLFSRLRQPSGSRTLTSQTRLSLTIACSSFDSPHLHVFTVDLHLHQNANFSLLFRRVSKTCVSGGTTCSAGEFLQPLETDSRYNGQVCLRKQARGLCVTHFQQERSGIYCLS